VLPVVASIYCSPHPAALQIAPAARLREFCLYDSAPGKIITMGTVSVLRQIEGTRKELQNGVLPFPHLGGQKFRLTI